MQAQIGRPPAQLVGGWELGLVILMAVLFAGGALVNPAFFGSSEAFHAVLRDTARYAVMAVGMTFVIVNKDLDLSVGSTYGLVGVAFSILFAPSFVNVGAYVGGGTMIDTWATVGSCAQIGRNCHLSGGVGIGVWPG